MAEVLVQNMYNPDQVIAISVTIRRMLVAEEGSGNPVWVVVASTDEADPDGVQILPVRTWVVSKDNLTEEITSLISQLCRKVGWNNVADTTPPRVINNYPLSDAKDVPLDTKITISLKEDLPSAGIDLGSVKLFVKGFDVTDKISKSGWLDWCAIEFVPGTQYQYSKNEDFDNAG